jgi:outer membrane receptor protein involved in Fe transport
MEQINYAGLSLADALTKLQQQGLTIVYSTALVRPDMRVEAEPKASEPRALLDEILRPHGLAVREGPGNQLVIIQATSLEPPSQTGTIRGRVVIDANQSLLAGITVSVLESDVVAILDSTGRFSITNIPVGTYTLKAESSAFLSQLIAGVVVRHDDVTRVRFHLSPASVFLNEIIVTPSHFKILEEQPEVRQFLSEEEVAQMPHVADDLYRAVKRLPGAAGGDYSAKFNVRGGESDEVLVILDGLELYEPFHLKDFQSIFSIIDTEAVSGVDFLTGGFPVEYGDRMSGVMDISTATPTGSTSTSVSVNTINAKFASEGGFNENKGQWVATGRAWYPDAIFDVSGTTANEILSDYYDLLTKVEYQVGRSSTLSAHLLASYDDLGFRSQDEEETEKVKARYASHHFWLNWRTQWSDSLYSQTVLSNGRVRRERVGRVDDIEEGILDIDDNRDFDVFGFKQDWTLELDNSHLLKWGFDIKDQRVEYEYESLSVVIDPDVVGDGPAQVDSTLVKVDRSGNSYSAYIGDRFRIGEGVVAEAGLRWDKQFWSNDHQVSPRLNARYSVSPSTTLRAAWGRFHQSQRLNEMQVEDGVTDFYAAQLAEHWLASFEHRFSNDVALRVEAYHKQLKDLRPRYENLFNPIELFPEAQQDRVLIEPDGGRARGLEVLLKRDSSEVVTWWLSYSLAVAEDEVDGEFIPRSWDQRHAASLGLNFSLPRGWNLNLAGTVHTGWPMTSVRGQVVGWEDEEPDVELTYGPRNGDRYPYYFRLDLRASKTWPTRSGEFALIFEAVNFTNRKNTCCIEDFSYEVRDDGTVDVIPEYGTWAPIIPSLGVRWVF